MTTATLNGLNFEYTEHGDGVPIVLAHGYCASSAMWDQLTPVLAKRYKVITYDARGHGLSSAPPNKEDYTLSTLVEDMAALLDHLGVQETYLVGHSMGGATVQAFAAQHPDRALATLICNIDGGHQPQDEETTRQASALREKSRVLVRGRGICDYARAQLESRAAPSFVCDNEHERQAYLERYARQPLNGYFGVGEALPWREAWLKDTVTSLTGPVAIIAGTLDVMHVGAQALHAKLPESRFVSIKGAPHDSVNARPAAFNQAVLEFLDSVENGSQIKGRFAL
jgi:3-oxoadipate enol-lactonase